MLPSVNRIEFESSHVCDKFIYTAYCCDIAGKRMLLHETIEFTRVVSVNYIVLSRNIKYASHKYCGGDNIPEALLLFEIKKNFQCIITRIE